MRASTLGEMQCLSKGSRIDLTGSGEAYVFRDEVGVSAQWHRTDEDQPLLLTGLNGDPINLRPGITFYEVLGEQSFVDQDEGEWHFHGELSMDIDEVRIYNRVLTTTEVAALDD